MSFRRIEIKIKIALLMAKFESSTVGKRKLQSNFGKNTPTEHGIRNRFERFCETGSIEDRIMVWKSDSKINQKKVNEVK